VGSEILCRGAEAFSLSNRILRTPYVLSKKYELFTAVSASVVLRPSFCIELWRGSIGSVRNPALLCVETDYLYLPIMGVA
jgi:hypothetical protein